MKKCDRCAKPAVYHITEIRDGEAQALHFCEQCAKQHLSHPEAEEGPEPGGGGEKSAAVESDTFDEVDQQVCRYAASRRGYSPAAAITRPGRRCNPVDTPSGPGCEIP